MCNCAEKNRHLILEVMDSFGIDETEAIRFINENNDWHECEECQD